MLMVFVFIATHSKRWSAFTTSVPKFHRLSLKRVLNVIVKSVSSRKSDEATYEKRASFSLKCRSVKDGACKRQAIKSKKHLRELSLLIFAAEKKLAENNVILFGYLQRDIEVPNMLRASFDNFPPIFKNTSDSNEDNSSLIKTYAESERKGVRSQPRKKLIFSSTLRNSSLITPPPLFTLNWALFV